MHGPLDWDDLRFLLATVEGGSFAAAARRLRVDQATVGRRLRGLERTLATPLFERTPGTLALTEAGRRAVLSARRMGDAALLLEASVTMAAPQVSGLLRVTATDALASRILVPRLGELTARHPALDVELLTGNEALNLSRREADLAVRLFRPVAPGLAARQVGRLAFGLYAARAYAERRGPLTEETLAEHALLGYDRMISKASDALSWLDRIPGARIALRANSSFTTLAATRAGLGVGLLPCFLADGDPALVRVVPRLWAREIWLAVHGDLRRTPRLRAGLDFLAEVLTDAAPLLRGDASAPEAASAETSDPPTSPTSGRAAAPPGRSPRPAAGGRRPRRRGA